MHDGLILKNFLKEKAIKIGQLASLLNMSRQNLNYHLRKDKMDEDFERLLKDKSGIKRKSGQFVQLSDQELKLEDSISFVPFLSATEIPSFIRNGGTDDFINELNKLPYKQLSSFEHSLIIESQDDRMNDNSDKAIKEGDLLLAEFLDKNILKSQLTEFNKVFILFSKKSGCICTQIINHNLTSGLIECRFWNNFYSNITINSNDVIAILFAKRIIDRKLIL